MLGLYVADIFVSQEGCEMSFAVSDDGCEMVLLGMDSSKKHDMIL